MPGSGHTSGARAGGEGGRRSNLDTDTVSEGAEFRPSPAVAVQECGLSAGTPSSICREELHSEAYYMKFLNI